MWEISMGMTVSLMLSKRVRGIDDFSSYALAGCIDALDRIAKANGITPPLSGLMCDPEAEAEDLSEGEVLEDRWYNPQEGLHTVSGLIRELEKNDGRASKKVDKSGGLAPLVRKLGVKSEMDGKWAETVLVDLKKLERILQVADKKGVQFILMLD